MRNKGMTQGISLIALIVTIVILIIISSVTIPLIQERTNQAKLANQNTDISILQEEVESYYNSHDGSLPVTKDGGNNDKAYPIEGNQTLYAQIMKNGENEDTFYILDMKKVGKSAGNTGDDNLSDDVYLVSSVKHNIYYAKGLKIKGVVYHSRIDNNSGVVEGTKVTPIPRPGDGSFDGLSNSPKLAAGMIPIRYDSTFGTWSDLTDQEKKNTNHEWYDYRNSGPTANRWANVRLADGSMLVWIPRYTYQIASGEHTGTEGTINIKFSNGTIDDTTGGYRIHPAFYWGGWDIPANSDMIKQAGGVEMKGIWVGKFEASAANGLQDTSGDRIAIKPNVTSWRSLRIGDMFNKTVQIQTLYPIVYGIDTNLAAVDAHMLKNSEWGACAYLSKYARGITEVAANDDPSFIGGKGNYSSFTGLSTTGTEYGIYDMSGGAWEYVACYVNNGNANLNTYGSALVNSSPIYKDVFPVAGSDNTTNNYNLTNKAYGHAFWEVSNGLQDGAYAWFKDYSGFMELSTPFARRGGTYDSGIYAGMFYFYDRNGSSSANGSWRVSVAVL